MQSSKTIEINEKTFNRDKEAERRRKQARVNPQKGSVRSVKSILGRSDRPAVRGWRENVDPAAKEPTF